MRLKNKQIRKYYQELPIPEVGKKTDCPDIDSLINSFSDELTESQKFNIIDHISDCQTCLEKFNFIEQIFRESRKVALGKNKLSLHENEVKELKELAQRKILELKTQNEATFDGAQSIPGKSVPVLPKITAKFISIAAVLIIAVLGTIIIIRTLPEPEMNMIRGSQEDTFLLIAPKGEITKKSLIFKWNAFPGAKEYDVRIMNAELTNIWISDKTRNTSIKLPGDLYQKITRDTIYYWKVIAYLNDGNIEKSHIIEFEFKPN